MKKSSQQSRKISQNNLFEKRLLEHGVRYIAGVDEVGRGCLAGPVLAAAVILPFPCNIDGITDSKKLTPKKREELSKLISESAVSVGFGFVGPEEIDEINILNASLKAMMLAVLELSPRPEYVLVDGLQTIPLEIPQLALTKGDLRSISIGAASIVAKVKRDKMMAEMESDFPGFSFSAHKGYGTSAHLAEINKHGPTEIHRRSFKGV